MFGGGDPARVTLGLVTRSRCNRSGGGEDSGAHSPDYRAPCYRRLPDRPPVDTGTYGMIGSSGSRCNTTQLPHSASLSVTDHVAADEAFKSASQRTVVFRK